MERIRTAVAIFTLWTILLMVAAAFSAFGTACNTCEDQIDRGTWIMSIALAGISVGTLTIMSRIPIVTKKLAVLLSGAAAEVVVTYALIQILMPV